MNRFILAVAFLSLGHNIAAQDVQESNSLVVFSLSHYEWQIPGGALSLVDEQIASVFAGLGRYEVTALPYRLDNEGIAQLISEIEKIRDAGAEDAGAEDTGTEEARTDKTDTEGTDIEKNGQPAAIRLGQEVIPYADFRLIAEASVAVVPVMSVYSLTEVDGKHTADLLVSFTMLDIASGESLGLTGISVQADGDSGRAAVQTAADGVAPGLLARLDDIPEFRLRGGIIDVRGRRLLLGFGENMGVKPGDEYVLVSGGQEDSGLLIIQDVKSEISIATLLHSDQLPTPEDNLYQIRRVGLETGVSLRTLYSFDGIVGSAGVRQSFTRGFASYRPIAGLDVPFGITGSVDLPGLILNFYGGGEINWYLWRYQFVPTAAMGIALSFPVGDSDAFRASHAGGFVELVASYRLHRDINVSLALGFSGWFILSPEAGDSYFGPTFGLGGTYKY